MLVLRVSEDFCVRCYFLPKESLNVMNRRFFVLGCSSAVLAGCAGHHANSLLPSTKIAGSKVSIDPTQYPAPPLPTNPIIGEVRRFDGTSLPSGWLLCDGRSLSVGQYPALAQMLHGPRKPGQATTFTLPTSSSYTFVIATSGIVPSSPSVVQTAMNSRYHRFAVVNGLGG